MEIFAVEVFDGHIKIEYADGSSEEVDGGIYERKNANGRTVEQRATTAADSDRLAALAGEFEAATPPSSAEVTKVQVIGDNIEIEYADGTRERIEDGVYERKDADNETIIERTAADSDVERLSDLALLDGGDNSPGDDGTPDQGPGDAPGTPGADDPATGSGDDDGTPDQGSGDAPGTPPSTGDNSDGSNAPEPTILGTDSADEIRGTRGADVIDGLGGDDEIRGRRGDDVVNGGGGNDLVRGDEGNDIVNGGNGDDKVKGDAGDDVLNGDAGSDIYDGGRGADTFVFEADGELDKINDFEDGVDVIDLTSYGFADASEVLALATEQGFDVYFNFGGGDLLKIDDTRLAQIDETDFIV